MGINVKAIKQPAAEAAIDKFVDNSPVAESKPKPAADEPKTYEKLRGNMVQTTITMTPEDLEQINAWAKQHRMSRAAFIRHATFKFMEGGNK